jgi:hypothetical protein
VTGVSAVKLSISEAARRAGVSRTNIYRKLNAGRLSKEADDNGNLVIDLSELARLYPHAIDDPGHLSDTTRTPHRAPYVDSESAALRELVAVLQQDKDRLAAELDRVRTEARVDADNARIERERLVGLIEGMQRQLADLRPKDDPPPPITRRRWWRRSQ